jgi:2-polyprenyl-3-methyl-5-hydroxy-6-metoxy-1,4-benzoquinol methylase
MSTLVSAKQILSTYDIFTPTDKKGNITRGTAHEFQDYAYRLAADLNDLNNLIIYLRLSKTVPRNILEQVYSFVADSKIENKGRLFLWKLKKLREEIQVHKDLQNFEYTFVTKKTRIARNSLKDLIIKKHSDEDSRFLLDWLNNNVAKLDKKSKALVIGNSSLTIPVLLSNKNYNVTGIDVSSSLNNYLKENFKNVRGLKFMQKELISNKFKDNSFDLIVFNRYWNLIPLESEIRYLREMVRLLKIHKGSIVISYIKASDNKESWIKFTNSKFDNYLFEKRNSTTYIRSLFEKFFNIEKEEELMGQNFLTLRNY